MLTDFQLLAEPTEKPAVPLPQHLSTAESQEPGNPRIPKGHQQEALRNLWYLVRTAENPSWSSGGTGARPWGPHGSCRGRGAEQGHGLAWSEAQRTIQPGAHLQDTRGASRP